LLSAPRQESSRRLLDPRAKFRKAVRCVVEVLMIVTPKISARNSKLLGSFTRNFFMIFRSVWIMPGEIAALRRAVFAPGRLRD